MPQRTRAQLYPEFANGQKPDGNDFRNLIDSFHSSLDDQSLTLGKSGNDGDIFIKNSSANDRIHLDGQSGGIFLKNTSSQNTISLLSSSGDLTLGGNGVSGDIFIKNSSGTNTLNFRGNNGSFFLKDSSGGNTMIFEPLNFSLPFIGTINTYRLSFFHQGSRRLFLSGYGFNGKPGGGEWGDSTSDKRLKKNIENYKKGLSSIKLLNPVTYQYNGKGETLEDGVTYCGFIAQELQKRFPEMIYSTMGKINTKDKKETEIYTVNSTDVKYMLINAVKELAEKVEKLETQLSKRK